jgi:quaternary ammonium compound-resistance protein SugE
MAWLVLVLAGLGEVGWAVGLKYTAGFTRLWPSVATVAAMGVSLYLLAVALKSLPLGTAYAVWTGIGTTGTSSASSFSRSRPMPFASSASASSSPASSASRW